MGRCIVVDVHDAIIREDETSNLAPHEYHRISAIWVTSPEGKILLAKRSQHKKHEPSLWSVAVAGTVEPGETYEENAHKEFEEELGVAEVQLREGSKGVFFQRVCQWFHATIPEDTPLYPRPREVDEVRWVTPDELRRWWHAHPEQFTKNAPLWLPTFLERL